MIKATKYKNYYVSDSGEVFRIIKLKPFMSKKKNGYLRVSINTGQRKYISVHRLVAETFHREPEANEHVNHKDKDRENNGAANLEVIHYLENMKHRDSYNKEEPS